MDEKRQTGASQRRRRRLNLRTAIPASMIGAVVGLAIGYTVASFAGSAGSFLVWAGFDQKYVDHADDAVAWAIGGAIVAISAAFLRRQN